MKSDAQLKTHVIDELAWDPAVDATRIGVAVNEGIVTLNGQVDTYMQKHAVERAVRRIAGVRGIALDLEVRVAPPHARSDTEIAHAALHALRWHSLVPEDRVKVEVENGWVTLSGEVEWGYQSASAEQCVQPLVGVTGVTNRLTIRQHANPKQIRADIAAALARHAEREAKHIEIEVDAGVVTLRGNVGTLAEHEAAIGTASSSRGVLRVVDQLRVGA